MNATVIIERELVRLGRRWQTMALRAGFAALVFVVVAVVYAATHSYAGLVSAGTLSQVGRGIYVAWVSSMMMAVLALTPVLVGQAMIDERDEHTLEVLTITRLSPRQILWGKLLSRLAMMETLLLSALPVLAVVLGFGGVAPTEMLAAFLLLNLQMALTGVAATFLALYARSVVVVLLQTWGFLFTTYFTVSLAGGFVLQGSGMVGAHPGMALVGISSGLGTALSMTLFPLLVWTPAMLLMMHVAALCFETIAFGAALDTAEDADLSSRSWALGRMTTVLTRSFFGLVLLAPLMAGVRLVIAHSLPATLVAYLYLAATMAVASALYLLLTRRSTLRRNSKMQDSGRKVSWQALSSHFQELDAHEGEAEAWRRSTLEPGHEKPGVAAALDGRKARPRRILSPFQREVWDDPVAWREVSTNAHGRLRRGLVGLYFGLGAMLLIAASFGAFNEAEVAVAMGGVALASVPLFTVLLVTSSIVGERRAKTLELLAVTRLSAARIVGSKIWAAALLQSPTLIVGGFMFLVGGASTKGPFLPVVIGLLWFFAINLFIATASMWRALTVETPSRAWSWNVVLLILGFWGLSIGTTVFSVSRSSAMLWSLVVPFTAAQRNPNLVPLMGLVSIVLWLLAAGFFGAASAQALNRVASK